MGGVAVQLKTVLIVDEDLGFVFWLGHLLNNAGYQVWPARNGEDAAALMEELGAELDLLIINPNLHGAAAFLETQRNSRNFRTIALERREEWVRPLAGVDIALAKPPHPDELSGLEWIAAIRNLLSSDD